MAMQSWGRVPVALTDRQHPQYTASDAVATTFRLVGTWMMRGAIERATRDKCAKSAGLSDTYIAACLLAVVTDMVQTIC